jgi:CheY-like chemotaxis protein
VTTPAKRVLIADDDAAIRRLIELSLGERFDLALAADGVQALDLLRSRSRFDCVVLDVTMPQMGGLEVLREMRSDAALASVPVIVLTAHENAELGEELSKAGSVTFLNKPFDRKRLRQLICDITGLESGASSAPPAV